MIFVDLVQFTLLFFYIYQRTSMEKAYTGIACCPIQLCNLQVNLHKICSNQINVYHVRSFDVSL